jgi:hypothetical protein
VRTDSMESGGFYDSPGMAEANVPMPELGPTMADRLEMMGEVVDALTGLMQRIDAMERRADAMCERANRLEGSEFPSMNWYDTPSANSDC